MLARVRNLIALAFWSWKHGLDREAACMAEVRLQEVLEGLVKVRPEEMEDIRLQAHHALQKADQSLGRVEALRVWSDEKRN